MRVNKEFHECMRAYSINEMIDAYDRSEDTTLSSKLRYRAAVRADFWRKLAEEDAQYIHWIKNENIEK